MPRHVHLLKRVTYGEPQKDIAVFLSRESFEAYCQKHGLDVPVTKCDGYEIIRFKKSNLEYLQVDYELHLVPLEGEPNGRGIPRIHEQRHLVLDMETRSTGYASSEARLRSC